MEVRERVVVDGGPAGVDLELAAVRVEHAHCGRHADI